MRVGGGVELGKDDLFGRDLNTGRIPSLGTPENPGGPKWGPRGLRIP